MSFVCFATASISSALFIFNLLHTPVAKLGFLKSRGQPISRNPACQRHFTTYVAANPCAEGVSEGADLQVQFSRGR